ncbi:hypothetical protein BH11MYX1_BH11MYX1_37290 [soil metagenome]
MTRPFTFWCEVCELELANGVDYSACPKCGGTVQWIDLGPMPISVMPSLARMTRVMFAGLVATQIAFALLDPERFAYLEPMLLVAQLAALIAVGSVVIGMPTLRGLLTEHVRIIHGMEHATAGVLEECGVVVRSGQAYEHHFELCVESGAHTERDVRSAATVAIRRVSGGEHALVYSVRCGTSMLAGWLMAALAIGIIGIVGFVYAVPVGYELAGTVLLVALARRGAIPLGLFAQRAWTVSANLASARVGEVTRRTSADGDRTYYNVSIAVERVPATIAEPIG